MSGPEGVPSKEDLAAVEQAEAATGANTVREKTIRVIDSTGAYIGMASTEAEARAMIQAERDAMGH